MRALIRAKTLLPLSALLASALLLPDLAEANKFETISGGFVSGDKLKQLKLVGLIAGGFFAVASIGLFFGRKKLAISSTTPIVIFLLGLFLASFWLMAKF
jgi:hypothetical protein